MFLLFGYSKKLNIELLKFKMKKVTNSLDALKELKKMKKKGEVLVWDEAGNFPDHVLKRLGRLNLGLTENKKVAIVISSYKPGKLLIDCLNSLKKTSYPNYKIFLVNDSGEKLKVKIKGSPDNLFA